mgnify:CR=1 FL=1
MSTELNDTEFQKQIKSLGETELSHEHSEELNTFLKLSSDFTTFFTNCTLADYRNLKKNKPLNLIYLMSHVSLPVCLAVWSSQTEFGFAAK